MKTLITLSSIMAGSALILMAASNLSMSDREFAKAAASGGMEEVQLGQLAVQHASNTKVKDFGQRMVDDHTKTNDQLMSIAAKDNITLPTTMEAKDKSQYDRLSNLTGPAFDKAYMSNMVKDHEHDISAFEKEANSQDTDMKNFATNTLPTLREHLRLAKEAAQAVGAPVS
ncbi:MAG TPA: DUF4142 domain-containing protein [Bryobacteraceae bacterium]|jgi:putative membrane protein|nr:DUF4142 domain-containing protein [Bryobacteraceae bacterium]